jgi:phosphoglycolate phosphatase-like HAD superfamily hydrolase
MCRATRLPRTRGALRAAGFGEAEIGAGLERWCRLFSARYVNLLAAADTSHSEIGPGAEQVLAAVERPALLTGNPPAVARARLERPGLARFFSDGQCAFGASAHAAGCKCVAVTTGRYDANDLAGADAAIADLTQLEAALQE